MAVISLILSGIGVFLLVADGQLVLGCCAAALASLFTTGRGRD